ncbi:MAG TPA: hypothetical protein PLH11_12335 [Gemmobacter sp.]|nr:hypothetical protein [Gemmobacter sp.]
MTSRHSSRISSNCAKVHALCLGYVQQELFRKKDSHADIAMFRKREPI